MDKVFESLFQAQPRVQFLVYFQTGLARFQGQNHSPIFSAMGDRTRATVVETLGQISHFLTPLKIRGEVSEMSE